MNRRSYYLKQLGITEWQLQSVNPAVSLQLHQLAKQVAGCTKCGLCHSRKQTVFGRGSATARLLLVGEAPGFREDEQGQPFVGPAGMLLTQMLQALAIAIDDVYICNILKCRPPENRDPSALEVEMCTEYLEAQIQLIQPKMIVALGKHAGHFFMGNELSVAKMRSQTTRYGSQQIPVYVSYHPAYLLRNPRDKALAYQDWLRIQAQLND